MEELIGVLKERLDFLQSQRDRREAETWENEGRDECEDDRYWGIIPRDREAWLDRQREDVAWLRGGICHLGWAIEDLEDALEGVVVK